MPTRSVPDAPMVAPALMPPTDSGNCWPWKVNMPLAAGGAENKARAHDPERDLPGRGFGRRQHRPARQGGPRNDETATRHIVHFALPDPVCAIALRSLSRARKRRSNRPLVRRLTSPGPKAAPASPGPSGLRRLARVQTLSSDSRRPGSADSGRALLAARRTESSRRSRPDSGRRKRRSNSAPSRSD